MAAPYKNWAVDSQGNVVGEAQVEVFDASGDRASIFSDNAGSALANPFNAAADGSFEFWAATGEYTVVTGVAPSTASIRVIIVDINTPFQPYRTRPALVTAVENGLVVPDGTTIKIGDLSYRAQIGATAIADLPGWVPVGDLYPDHFAENATPGTTDMGDAMRAAAEYAKTVVDSRAGMLVATKVVTVTERVRYRPGRYHFSSTVPLYSGVVHDGAGESLTLLEHAGGGGVAFDFTRVASEEIWSAQIRNLAIKGAGKTVSDTRAGVRSDIGNNAAIRFCGLFNVEIYNCYDDVSLDDCYTFEIDRCYLHDSGRNSLRWQNATAGAITNNRIEGAGEDGVYLTGTTTRETIGLLVERNAFQSNQRRGFYGVDVNNFTWVNNFVESNNQVGGYAQVEFSDGAATLGETYVMQGGFITPGSGATGDSALKIERARLAIIDGLEIRGNGFATGIEIGANVTSAVVNANINGPATPLSRSSASTNLETKMRSDLRRFYGEGTTNGAFDAQGLGAIFGVFGSDNVGLGVIDGKPAVQGLNNDNSPDDLMLNPAGGRLNKGAMTTRRAFTTGNFTPSNRIPMLVTPRASGAQSFDLSSLSASDETEYSFLKLDDGGTVNVVPSGAASVNGGTAGATLSITGAGTAGLYLVIGATTNDWRVVKAAEA